MVLSRRLAWSAAFLYISQTPWFHQSCDEIDCEGEQKGARSQAEKDPIISTRVVEEKRHAVGGERLAYRKANCRFAPSTFLSSRMGMQQFVDAPQNERNDPWRKCTNNDTRHDQPSRAKPKGRQCDSNRLNEVGEAKRASKAGSIGQVPTENWANASAQSEKDPELGSSIQTLTQPPGHEVNEEDHMRHEAHRIERI